MNTLKKDAAETATKAATGQSAALAFKTQAVLIGQDACSQHKHRSTLVVLVSWCFGRLGLAMKTRLGQTPRMYTCRRLGLLPSTRLSAMHSNRQFRNSANEVRGNPDRFANDFHMLEAVHDFFPQDAQLHFS